MTKSFATTKQRLERNNRTSSKQNVTINRPESNEEYKALTEKTSQQTKATCFWTRSLHNKYTTRLIVIIRLRYKIYDSFQSSSKYFVLSKHAVCKTKKKAFLMGVQTIFNSFPIFAYNLIIVLYQTEVTKWYRFIQM